MGINPSLLSQPPLKLKYVEKALTTAISTTEKKNQRECVSNVFNENFGLLALVANEYRRIDPLLRHEYTDGYMADHVEVHISESDGSVIIPHFTDTITKNICCNTI